MSRHCGVYKEMQTERIWMRTENVQMDAGGSLRCRS